MIRRAAFAFYGVLAAALLVYVVDLHVHSPLVAAIAMLTLASVGWTVGETGSLTPLQKFVMIPLAPLAIGGALLGVSVLLPLVVVWFPFIVMQQRQRRRHLLRELESQGRFRTAEQLHSELSSGHGTLLLEVGARGAYRIWWTADELPGAHSLDRFWHEHRSLWEHCSQEGQISPFLTQYLDLHGGTAALTDLPPLRTDSDLQNLKAKLPRMNVVLVFNP